jgi:GDPmannose 4,6-dehydratase
MARSYCGNIQTDGVAIDIERPDSVNEFVRRVKPLEIYYLAAYHHSSEDTVDDPRTLVSKSLAINTLALTDFLNAILKHSPDSRLFYASSSHVFGQPQLPIQDERTPLSPINVYGISKAAAMQVCRYFRNEHRVYASCGILYNHESHLRPPQFLSRKVVSAAVRISRGIGEKLRLRNLDALVDWGFAPDYTNAMWHMLQLPAADDFVVATGILHSVREFVETTFSLVGLEWAEHVALDGSTVTPNAASVALCGDSSKLRSKTGWTPQTSFREMIAKMIEAEIQQCNTTSGC